MAKRISDPEYFPGDRIVHLITGSYGTVERDDIEGVTISWDSGGTSKLTWNRRARQARAADLKLLEKRYDTKALVNRLLDEIKELRRDIQKMLKKTVE